METERYLAFDFGASSGRAIIGHFDGETIRLEEIHRFSNDPVMINGITIGIFSACFLRSSQGLIKYAQGGYGALSGIGIDTWGVDFGLIGRAASCSACRTHYRDSRTDGMLEEAQKRMPREEIFRSSGVSFEFFNTLNQLLAMVKQDSPALKNAKHLLFIPDLFAYFLTGNIGTEFCEATTSQLVDPATRTWSDKLIEAMGIPRHIFSEIEKPGTLRGYLLEDIQREVGLPAVPVYAIASHDTNAASAAVPAKGATGRSFPAAHGRCWAWRWRSRSSTKPPMKTTLPMRAAFAGDTIC